jgi:hypothetical protein
MHFVMEGGFGEHISQQQPNSGMYLHISFGLLLNVGKDRKREERAGKFGTDSAPAGIRFAQF